MKRKKKCKLEGCGRYVKAKELCQTHYRQLSAGEEFREVRGLHGRAPDMPKMKGSVGVYGRVSKKHAKALHRLAKSNGVSTYRLISEVMAELAEKAAVKAATPQAA